MQFARALVDYRRKIRQVGGSPAKARSKVWSDSLCGIVKVMRELQPANALFSILATESGMARLVNELQPSNAPYSIQVTDSGIVRLVSDLHPLKACSPTSLQQSGRLRLVKELQPRKAPFPILGTDRSWDSQTC